MRRDTLVAVVVSDRVSAYQRVVDALGTRLNHVAVFAVDGDARKAHTIIAKLREQPDVPIIAIGSLAARAAAAVSDRPVVFCQDFDLDYRRPAGTMYGVRASPPAMKQLQAWKKLDPRLRYVVLISGTGLGEFVREARAAARESGVRLEHIEVQSDRELLYAAKRLEANVQGLWFAPDNRVLSAEVLREVLAHSVRQGKQALVFSSQLLGYGALVSVESDPEDVAERALEQLAAADRAGAPRVLPVSRVRVEINAEVAVQLGLTVPRAMQGVYVF